MFTNMKLLVGLAMMLMALPEVGVAAPPMQPGLWEVTMTMEMPGMPMAMAPTKNTQCIKDVGNTEKIIPKGQNCALQNQNSAGDKITWTVMCKEGDTVMNGSGEITFKGSSYEGFTKMTMKEGADEAVQMTTRYSARRIGACK